MLAPEDKKLAPRLMGKCKFYNAINEFGFITGDDGEDRFFNSNHIQPGHDIVTGARVSFISTSNRRGLVADRIKCEDTVP